MQADHVSLQMALLPKARRSSCVSGNMLSEEWRVSRSCSADSERKWRNYQFFVATGWPGGVYASPSLAGSRPGALLAGAWTAMQYMGANGYLESCKQIVGAARRIEAGIRAIPELKVLGDPKVTVVAFESKELAIYAIGDRMSEKGWHRKLCSAPSVCDAHTF